MHKLDADNLDDALLQSLDDALLQQAWGVSRAHFPMEITVVRPGATTAVSVTGSGCALNCAHCGRHYLKGMKSLQEVLSQNQAPGVEDLPQNPQQGLSGEINGDFRESRQVAQQPQSYLISGGCTREGKVPILPFLDQIGRLGDNARLNVHPGLVNKKEAAALAQVADTASFDFVGSSSVIREVYGLHKDVSDYRNSYRYLVESFGVDRVVPHITLGLAKGQLSNEIEAVKALAGEGISRLVLLIFRPTPGTPLGHLTPPPLADVISTIARMRLIIPSVPIYLGCMRPGGCYRSLLDPIALRCGVNKIVQPAANIEAAAGELGLEIKYEWECCSL